MLRALLLIAGLSLSSAALAVIETYEFADETLRERFADLADELRCPKCQNQNIADSNAPIAADLRKQLHAQLHEGRSDREIVEYMVNRYGEFVLYRPRVNNVTLVLWAAPAILLLLAVLVLRSSMRGRAPAAAGTLSADERAKLDALLADDEEQA
ncbi:MAG: cytochrome c-type biogenesis protein CcmH [Halieaceae bacterium]|nr:cytochrome c-type biogenesis protein CcmH [Halieaceae bacterium]